MRLRVFLPNVDAAEAATRFAWMLFDARRNVLRQDATPLADAPRAEEVEAVLPAARVLFARLRLPRVSERTIRELLPYAVEDRLLADPSRIHAVAGRTQASGETPVAVVDRDWLLGMLGTLRRAGLEPKRAWCESALLAGGKADWNVVWGPAQGILVDDEGVSVAFDRSGKADLPLAVRIALDEAAARGERPAEVRVHPEAGEALPDLARWSSETGVPFSSGTAWESLRGAEPWAGSIDLLSGDLRSSRGRLSAARIPAAAWALLAAIGLLQLGFVAADAWRLKREHSRIEARREAVFRAAFPEARVVVDPALQMSRNVSALRSSRGLASDDDFLAQLTRAARERHGPVRSIEYAQGRLRVSR
jgi:general secretion pathway protein L